jgi:hypothetical protein
VTFSPSLSFFGFGPRDQAQAAGFRFGDKGTHSSRTLMYADLAAVLAATESRAIRKDYADAIIESNCLHKPTASTRRLSNQRLGELYSFERSCPCFRVLRRLWRAADAAARPQLALLMAMARDPLLLASASAIIPLPEGMELQRSLLRDTLRTATRGRLSEPVLEKVGRNVASTWTQTGHLKGRTFKFRQKIGGHPGAVAYALYLGRVAGFSGRELFASGWMAVLDCTPSDAERRALEAKRLGLIDLRIAEDVVELGLERLDPASGGV